MSVPCFQYSEIDLKFLKMHLIVTVIQNENTSITNERITLKIQGIRMFWTGILAWNNRPLITVITRLRNAEISVFLLWHFICNISRTLMTDSYKVYYPFITLWLMCEIPRTVFLILQADNCIFILSWVRL